MKYVSVDIETFGLNPETCDMFEVAAVVEDTENLLHIDALPHYRSYIGGTPGRTLYRGDLHAFKMHILKLNTIITESKAKEIVSDQFQDFLFKHFKRDPVTFAGKNFSTFDLVFLLKNGFLSETKYHHRILDVGSVFFDGTSIPSLKECCERANVIHVDEHDALHDAKMVIQCLRTKYGPGLSN